MPDYGHTLRFAANLLPTNHDTAQVVALAQEADAAGLDLLTFQDHPYHHAFLDTWTLLSYVAAATTRIHLAGNVHPLPLRPPAMLARSAAALDILSGGRVELGLGSGGYWDAIEAMGVPRLGPAEAVEALDEGIEIIRQTWDTSAPGPIRVRGRHHRVEGVHRGPRPAHDIEIWLGANRPRMLQLTGRAADGWLPSLPHIGDPARLGEGNTIIDEAAEEAGRSPRDIRRLLNLGGPMHPEQLAELTLRYGVSTFTQITSSSRDIRQLADETAPAVRELVEKERAVLRPS